jgi:hypothetical protein
LVHQLKALGFDDEFVTHRLAGISDARKPSATDTLLAAHLSLATSLRNVYGWDPQMFVLGKTPSVDARAVAEARFKLPSRVHEPRLAVYTVYAHYLALLVLKATSIPQKTIPRDHNIIRTEITSTHGGLTFEGAVRYAWSLGIPVLPLADSGTFHGAMWRSKGRSIMPRVAAEEGVQADSLANYLAYRLWQEKKINWWGAATNLQRRERDPWVVCRDILLTKLDVAELAPDDQRLLRLALEE